MAINGHHPANKSWAGRDGISSVESRREYAHTIVNTGNNVGLRV
jgi:hypothetical protein